MQKKEHSDTPSSTSKKPIYNGNPKKEIPHILVYAGRFSGETNEIRELVDLGNIPKSVLMLISELEKNDKNPILYIDNDTVKYETMQQIIITVDENQEGFVSIKEKAIKNKIPFVIIADHSHFENYCSSLRQKNFSA